MSKISLISRVLDHFYPAPPIPLNHFDNFTLLVSVVLSAQTTDGKVNEVTKKLFEVAPTPQLMCAMDASEIQRIIQPVGLAPKKSVYLKNLSQKIVDDFNGDVPSTYENLESLAGVGHKTASVVMSQVSYNTS
jgi:endonuclease III